jgi:hypothetical protein
VTSRRVFGVIDILTDVLKDKIVHTLSLLPGAKYSTYHDADNIVDVEEACQVWALAAEGTLNTQIRQQTLTEHRPARTDPKVWLKQFGREMATI